jgi:hypothetical protein
LKFIAALLHKAPVDERFDIRVVDSASSNSLIVLDTSEQVLARRRAVHPECFEGAA